MLRRGVRKLIPELEACLDIEGKNAAAGAKKKKGKAKERDDAVRAKMEGRARHVLEQLVPRAFLYVWFFCCVCGELGWIADVGLFTEPLRNSLLITSTLILVWRLSVSWRK